MTKRALITGGAGFVGSHLCDRFIGEGYAVIAVDNLITGNVRNIQHLMQNENFEFIEHDISEPLSLNSTVDVVMHFASPASPPQYLKYPLETLKVGSYGTHNALEIARSNDARFLMASTSEVYGDPEVHPQPESYNGNVSPNGPRSVYDEAKRYAEAVTMAYHTTYGLQTRIVRIFNTYGPRMSLEDGRVVPNFIDQAIKSEQLTVYGDGSQTRCFQYVDDLIEGIWRLLNSDYVQPVNIGTSREISVLEFATIVNQVAGNDPENLVIQPDKRIKDDPNVRKPDTTRAKEILDWEPQIELEDGLLRTIEYFRNL